MKKLCAYGLAGLLLCAVALTPRLVWGQAATTGTVIGQVTDQSGASVPGANVVLTDLGTKGTMGQVTNRDGRFAFSEVKPGLYDVSVTAKGFRKLTVASQEVLVGESLNMPLVLEVGSTTQSVEVKAVAGADLQTLNSTVGTTLGGSTVLALPNQNRDATTLLLYQPMTVPTFGGSNSNETGGQVAGAMSDQNTFTLDGGNATDDLAGDNNYIAAQRQYVGPQAAIPTPIESIEEFKVATNNQTADFSTSAGGQVMLVTKRGTNTIHGSAYDYFQANWLDASGYNLNKFWDENLHQVKQHQNRFGGSIGGPVLPSRWGGKTYFYGNYEGQRYPYTNGAYERPTPSALLREGIIQEKDTSGNIITYNLMSAKNCGTTGATAGTLPCDPRGLGIDPTIQNLWNKYMPLPNDPTFGDTLNYVGYVAPLQQRIRSDFMVARMDHDFGSKWRGYLTYRWYNLEYPSTNQVDIGGVLPGDTLGTPASASADPEHPRYTTIGLTATLTPSLTNEFHMSYLRDDWNWIRAGVPTGLVGIPAGLEVEVAGSENTGCTASCLNPLNFDTQSARNRLWDGQDFTYSDTVSWLHGNHYLQLGGQFYHFHDIHARDDDVVAALTQLGYQINYQSTSLSFGSSYIPFECSGTGQTGCMNSALSSNWEAVYAATAGFVGSAEQVFVRQGNNFTLNPGATELEDHSILDTYSLFVNDSWKIKSNLTVNYGLEWGVEMPPYELNGEQDIFTDSLGNAVSFNGLRTGMQTAALSGQVYNPILGFTPIRAMGTQQKYPFPPFYGAFSPRVSAAWSPAVKTDNWLGKIFGDRKTVLRGGYVRIYDRTNSVDMVLTPLIGYGFAQPVTCAGISSSPAGGTCLNTPGSVTPATVFRIGTDGTTAPLAAAATPITNTLSVPAEPGVNSPGAGGLAAVDTQWRQGSDDQFDFTIQRQLRGGLLVEGGWNGRWAKHLYQGEDINNVPVMMTLGGQSFTQAYYNLYQANLAGATPSPQPFFETALGAGNAYCSGYASCSAAVVAKEGTAGNQHIYKYNPYSVFADLDGKWNFAGCAACDILPADPGRYTDIDNDTTNGFANYQAMFLTVQKRVGQGMTISANYTYSHTLSTFGINQEYTNASPNFPWNLYYDYGPAPFDRTQVINAVGHYDLPFGKGKYFSTSNPVLDRIIGGWSFAPVYTWATGLPIETETGGGHEFGAGNIPLFSGMVPLTDTGSFGHTAHTNLHISGTATYPGSTFGSFVGTNDDPYADCGGKVCTANSYGVNLFSNPTAVYNNYRPALLGVDTHAYDIGPYHGQHRWNVDFTIAKQTHIAERWNVTFYAQFLNALNHMEFSDPGMDFLSPLTFGDSTTQFNSPRVIELGLRLAF